MSGPQTLVSAPSAPVPLLHSPLNDFHLSHGGHMVPFAGWEMPLYYTGIIAEHQAVRTHVGLFDVSHMGILTLSGLTAASLLSRRTTANVAKLAPGQCHYTFLLDASGEILDDLLVTRIDSGVDPGATFLAVPNAAHASGVFDLFRAHRRPDTTVARHNGEVAILAVQGPHSRELLEAEFGWELADLAFYHARLFPLGPTAVPKAGRLGTRVPQDLNQGALVGRTGYTGELGYELFVDAKQAVSLAERLVAKGAVPAGLGARDTLRLEKGYLLSGQDFHRDRTPWEAGQDRFVELDHPFVGRDAIEAQRQKGIPARLVGLVVATPGAIPRHGTPVMHDGKPVGVVTSGGLSPTLNQGIAIAYLPPALGETGTSVTLELRGNPVEAKVTALPFVRSSSRR